MTGGDELGRVLEVALEVIGPRGVTGCLRAVLPGPSLEELERRMVLELHTAVSVTVRERSAAHEVA